jgi:CheY-like chemotaxis protein
MIGLFAKKHIDDLHLTLGPDDARKRARILVIDDDEDAFPVKLLQQEGYNVHYWSRIENIRSLEQGEFDIIILDIGGISSPELSKLDGFGVLDHLKRYNPGQIIIAYSGRSFDLGQQQFFQKADDFLGKPSDLLECKQKIDRLIQTKFTVMHYWNTVVSVLLRNEVSEKKIRKFESLFVANAQRKQRLSAETIVNILKVSKEVAQTVFTILGLIVKFHEARP